MEPKFNLEYHYQNYLKLVSLDEKTMCHEQRLQLRDAFYASAGMVLTLISEDVTELPDEKAYDVLEGLNQQVRQHFTHRVIRGISPGKNRFIS